VLFNNYIELRTATNLVAGVETVLVTRSIIIILSGIIAETVQGYRKRWTGFETAIT